MPRKNSSDVDTSPAFSDENPFGDDSSVNDSGTNSNSKGSNSDMISDDDFSVFGSLDIDEVEDDPFYIEPNQTYQWLVTKAFFKKFEYQNKDTGVTENGINANLTLSVNNMDSKYHGKTVQPRYRVYPGLTPEFRDSLSPKERQTVDRNMSNFKNILRALGLSETQMTQLKPSNIEEKLVGRECYATLTVNTVGDKTYRNIVRPQAIDEVDTIDSSSSSIDVMG